MGISIYLNRDLKIRLWIKITLWIKLVFIEVIVELKYTQIQGYLGGSVG